MTDPAIVASSTSSIKDRYLDKLGLSVESVQKKDYESLCLVTERHLATIPFGNLSQHGLGLPASIDADSNSSAHKMLDRNREGFCYEVNLLLAQVLKELGFASVQLFDAQVFKGTFWTPSVHVWLLVDHKWFVDVGFGEPAIHPLSYGSTSAQTTPEGMTSRFVVGTSDDDNNGRSYTVLEWKTGDEWTPRLRWATDLKQPKLPEDFQPNLEMVLNDKLPFAHKFFVVKVTRTEKVSVSGNVWKRTSPRFGADTQVTQEILESMEQVRDKLEQEFGIPTSETEGLDWTKSLQAPARLWTAQF